MPNIFDSVNYPTSEPDELIIGDRWQWKRSDLAADYPLASYALTYSLRLLGNGNIEIELTASESGSDYIIEVGATTTAAFIPGKYAWAAYITDSGDSTKRVQIDSGTLTLQPNLSVSTEDQRSHARKYLDAIEAQLENRATLDQKSYVLPSGRQLQREDQEVLLRMRQYYMEEVRREENAEKIANGFGNDKFIGLRLRRG